MPVIVVDKPAGISSFGVVKKVGWLLRPRSGGARPRLGHGGTLDPLATGVLPVCVGEATKLATFLLGCDKQYEATLRFGVETDTLDSDGVVVAERPVGDLTAEAITDALAAFRGPIQQIPPMHSALKRDGKPLYEYARAGRVLDRQARSVVVHAFDLLSFDPPDRARVLVRCSKGTYVRVLAADVGTRLGVGAHLTGLRRTASGPFGLGEAATLVDLERMAQAGTPWPWITCSAALAHLPCATVGAAEELALIQGKKLPWEALAAGSEPVAADPVRVLREDGSLLAVATRGPDGAILTERIFHRDGPPDPAPASPTGSPVDVRPPLPGNDAERDQQDGLEGQALVD